LSQSPHSFNKTFFLRLLHSSNYLLANNRRLLSPMPEFLNLISPKCTSGPRLLVYSQRRQRQRGVSARGLTTPLKSSAAAVDVVDLAPLETPCTAGSSEAADPSAAARPHQASEIAGVAIPQATPLAIEHAPSARESFIAKTVQQTACILTVPASIKCSLKTRPARDTPRRSRRIAGAKVEFSSTELERRSRKNTMKALGVINEQGESLSKQMRTTTRSLGNLFLMHT
jgi:hypothetical protein